jgi:hypothetical protein
MSFNLKDYNTVSDRIAEFRKKHPEGSLTQHSLEFREFGGKSWVIYTAAAYRNPEDPAPGMGTAWEQVPGTTNFTKDSELQNAETAAWGRALIAVGAADARKGIASRDEVQRQAAANAAPEFIPSVAANELMSRVRNAASIEELAGVWESVKSGLKVGAINDTEHAVLKQWLNKRRAEMEKPDE